ncbi:hypothetical protein C5167_005798 [Papaver somniferum]|uniref:Uncharacterized protein n=1 Tax=Papaver somniferum TaxID=3469 RepID=A0A4Y7JFS4_PAPSO|nr:hypothetical protein C5167_005798 [Papaver somniferum]
MATGKGKQDIHSYHQMDREMYSRLVINLSRDPFRCMDIIALWMCVEHVSYPNFVLKIMKLKESVLNTAADEAILILDCITSKTPPPKLKSKKVIPYTLSLTSNKEISLANLYECKGRVRSGITQKVDEVCIKAFYDVLQKALEKNPEFRHQPTGGLNFGADKYRSELASLINVSASSSSTKDASNVSASSSTTNNASNVSASSSSTKNASKGEKRTMFVTFSRGFPTSDQELYGNCVERVHLQEKKQPLYARVVFSSSSTIKKFRGGQEKVKFTINGKQLYARRYLAK